MGKNQAVQKARFWRKPIQKAAWSGFSTRQFCRQRRLHECQFYWWQRRLAPAADRQGPPRETGTPRHQAGSV